MSAIVRVKDANGNVSSIPAIKGDKGDPADLATIQQKASIDDADLVLVADSTSNKSGKLVLWSTIKTALSNLYLGKTGDASNVTNAFTTAATKTDLTTGEKLSVSLGKIQKWFSSLGTAAFTASTAYDSSGAASGAVSTHNSASDAHSTLFAAKANTSALSAHAGATNNPHGVTKSQVGLGNVDNTADANKPVSTAQQTALDNKAGKKVPATTGNLATLDAAGNLADSGKTPASFAAASHAANHKTGGTDPLTPADIGAASSAHASAHKTGGSDALTPADIGAAPAGSVGKLLAVGSGFALDNGSTRPTLGTLAVDLSWTNDSVAGATGYYSFCEGQKAKAIGANSHAEGERSRASANSSHAEGRYTTATAFASHVQGQYNKALSGSESSYGSNYDAFVIGNGTSSDALGNAFRVTFEGKTYGLSAFNSSGADYAEYFEWADGNPNSEDRTGYFVTLDGEKIRKATSADAYILGIISARPSVIGDSYEDDWSGKYVTDEWGRIQYHNVDVPDQKDPEDNVISPAHTEYQPIYNPNWDSTQPYIPREQRKEWDAVGMMGKLLVRDDGTCAAKGFCKPNDNGIGTASTSGYYVMRRVAANIVEVLFR